MTYGAFVDKPFLHKELSFKDAALELNLDNISHAEAVKRILQYAQFDGLIIYLKSNISGYNINNPVTEITNHHGDIDRVMIDGNVNHLISSGNNITLSSGRYISNIEGQGHISVSVFQENKIKYYPVNESEEYIEPAIIQEESFVIYREDIRDFITRTDHPPNLQPLKENNIQNKISTFSAFHELENLIYDEIIITFINGDVIELSARTITNSCTYETLSLRDKRKRGKATLNKAGEALLNYSNGIHLKTGPVTGKTKELLKNLINKWFGLKSDPFEITGDNNNNFELRFKVLSDRNRAADREKKSAGKKHISLDQQDNDGLAHEASAQIQGTDAPDFDDEDDAAGRFLKE